MTYWVIWSEQHAAWWLHGSMGYTPSLRDAGRYNEAQARLIEDTANKFLPEGVINEVAMPDPWPHRRPILAFPTTGDE